MAIVKRIVCLANSRKLNGRCVAGKELRDGRPVGWLRPVSAREHEEVSENERQYEDGSDPQVLDIVDVPLVRACPKDYQQENWLLDPSEYWVRVRRATWGELPALVDPDSPLWIDGQHTYNGLNDRIALDEARALRNSLRFVHVKRLAISVFRPGEAFGNPKRRVQGRFRHNGTDYHLWVTDPLYERRYLARPDGQYEVGGSFLTVSLGEPFDGASYKLIATIVEREGGSQT